MAIKADRQGSFARNHIDSIIVVVIDDTIVCQSRQRWAKSKRLAWSLINSIIVVIIKVHDNQSRPTRLARNRAKSRTRLARSLIHSIVVIVAIVVIKVDDNQSRQTRLARNCVDSIVVVVIIVVETINSTIVVVNHMTSKSTSVEGRGVLCKKNALQPCRKHILTGGDKLQLLICELLEVLGC
jgi:hypothetical protein